MAAESFEARLAPIDALVQERKIDTALQQLDALVADDDNQQWRRRNITDEVKIAVAWRDRARSDMSAKSGSPILIYGEDQAKQIQEVLQRLRSLEGKFNFVYLPFYRGGRYRKDFLRELTEEADQFWQQVILPAQAVRSEELAHTCIDMRFPQLRCSALWPPLPPDGRNRSIQTPGHFAGLHPWSDAIAESLADEPLSDADLVQRYLQLSAAQLPDLHELLERDIAEIQSSEPEIGALVADYIRTHFRHERLFHTPSVAGGPLLRLLTEQLVAKLLSGPEHAQVAAELATLIEGYNGPQRWHLPISPIVAERFGLSWYRDDMTYGYNYTLWTFASFTIDRIKWRLWM